MKNDEKKNFVNFQYKQIFISKFIFNKQFKMCGFFLVRGKQIHFGIERQNKVTQHDKKE